MLERGGTTSGEHKADGPAKQLSSDIRAGIVLLYTNRVLLLKPMSNVFPQLPQSLENAAFAQNKHLAPTTATPSILAVTPNHSCQLMFLTNTKKNVSELLETIKPTFIHIYFAASYSVRTIPLAVPRQRLVAATSLSLF